MMRQALVVATNEVRVLLADRGQLLTLFLMPLMFATVIGSAFGGSPGISILLVNEDDGATARNSSKSCAASACDRRDLRRRGGRIVGEEALAPSSSCGVLRAGRARTSARRCVIVDRPRAVQRHRHRNRARVLRRRVAERCSTASGSARCVAGSGLWSRQRARERPSPGRPWHAWRSRPPPIAVRRGDRGASRPAASSAYAYSFPSYAVMFAFSSWGRCRTILGTSRAPPTPPRLPLTGGHHLGQDVAYMLVVTVQVLLVLSVGMAAFGVPARAHRSASWSSPWHSAWQPPAWGCWWPRARAHAAPGGAIS